MRPEYLVIHYTAGPSLDSAVNWFGNPAARASAHLVIGRDGSITQSVPFDTVAWHAGRSRWEGREGLNGYSLGIELDNAGRLIRQGDQWRSWFQRVYTADEVLESVHKNESSMAGWHTFTAEQIDATVTVSCLLFERYGLRDVVGHEDIAPGRKSDPGPAFPMSSFRAQVEGRADEREPHFLTTAFLNIRSGPGTEHPRVEGSPLPPETEVEVLREEGVWRWVQVDGEVDGIRGVEGWVHGRYLSPVRDDG